MPQNRIKGRISFRRANPWFFFKRWHLGTWRAGCNSLRQDESMNEPRCGGVRMRTSERLDTETRTMKTSYQFVYCKISIC